MRWKKPVATIRRYLNICGTAAIMCGGGRSGTREGVAAMIHRRLFWGTSYLLLILAGIGPYFLMPKPSVTKENFLRLKKGMTQANVQAILGPANDITYGNGLDE